MRGTTVLFESTPGGGVPTDATQRMSVPQKMSPHQQGLVQVMVGPEHFVRSPTTCFEHLAAYYCSAPNLGFCLMWLVDPTVFVVP